MPAAEADARSLRQEGREGDETVRPYTLERAVAIALRNNRRLAVSQYDLEVANKQVSEAYGALFPEIDGTASMQRNLELPSAFLPRIFIDPEADPDELIAVTFGADNQWNAGLTVNQPLFDAGVFVGVGTAGAFRSLAQEGLRGAAQGVATSTRIAYLNVLLAQEAVRVTQNSIERVRQTLEETRALNRAGLASDYDVLRLEVQLANIEPNLRRSRNEVDEARRVLAIEMGIGEGASAAAFGELHRIRGALARAGARCAGQQDRSGAGPPAERSGGSPRQVRADAAVSAALGVLQLESAGAGERRPQFLRREPGSAVHGVSRGRPARGPAVLGRPPMEPCGTKKNRGASGGGEDR
jgi:outer membrane protein TolC